MGKGINSEEHRNLQEAATMYRNITGKDISRVVSGVRASAAKRQASPEEQQRAQRELTAKANATKASEDADRRARQVRSAIERGDDIQDENPGPGQPAMVTERAKRAGVSRKGEEPQRTGQYSRHD